MYLSRFSHTHQLIDSKWFSISLFHHKSDTLATCLLFEICNIQLTSVKMFVFHILNRLHRNFFNVSKKICTRMKKLRKKKIIATRRRRQRKTFSAWVEQWYYLFLRQSKNARASMLIHLCIPQENSFFTTQPLVSFLFKWFRRQFSSCWLFREQNSRVN